MGKRQIVGIDDILSRSAEGFIADRRGNRDVELSQGVSRARHWADVERYFDAQG